MSIKRKRMLQNHILIQEGGNQRCKLVYNLSNGRRQFLTPKINEHDHFPVMETLPNQDIVNPRSNLKTN